jgi:hypothetical protein
MNARLTTYNMTGREGRGGGTDEAHITGHNYTLRIRADDVDKLARSIASTASQSPKAHRLAKDHRR